MIYSKEILFIYDFYYYKSTLSKKKKNKFEETIL